MRLSPIPCHMCAWMSLFTRSSLTPVCANIGALRSPLSTPGQGGIALHSCCSHLSSTPVQAAPLARAGAVPQLYVVSAGPGSRRFNVWARWTATAQHRVHQRKQPTAPGAEPSFFLHARGGCIAYLHRIAWGQGPRPKAERDSSIRTRIKRYRARPAKGVWFVCGWSEVTDDKSKPELKSRISRPAQFVHLWLQ